MKWVLLGALILLTIWSAVAYRWAPQESGGDQITLTWVSGDNPARRGTIDIFEKRHLRHRFDLPLNLQDTLTDNIIPDRVQPELRHAFEAEGVTLEPRAEIYFDPADASWRIDSGTTWYWLRRQEDRLTVHEPKIRIRLDPTNSGLEKIIVQCKGGIGPDIFNVYGRWMLVDFVRTNVLMPLEEHTETYGFGLDTTWPTVKEEISYVHIDPATGEKRRVQYTYPLNVNANVIFFHKRHFDEAGLPYPEGDWTWDEFLEVSRKLIHRGSDGRIDRYAVGTFEFLEATALVWQFGGDWFDPTGTYCIADSPEVIEAMTFLHRMIVIDRVMPSVAERDAMGTKGGFGGTLSDLFANERLSMMRIGRWALINLRKYYDRPERPLRGEIGAAPIPYKREKAGLVRALSVGINPNSPHKKEAMEFLKVLTSEEFSHQVIESADALPPSPDVARSDAFLKDPAYPGEDYNALFVQGMERGRNVVMTPFLQAITIQKDVDRHLALLSAGIDPPETTCRDLAREMNDKIRANLIQYESMRIEYKHRTGMEFDPENFPPRHDGEPHGIADP